MFFNSNASEVFQKKIVLADNDFLGLIYENQDLLKETLALLSGKKLYLYPFTQFEFLRDVFLPKIRVLKEQFVESETFGHIREDAHMRIFPRIFENALLLSKIFAHQSLGKSFTSNKGISFVDLLLASLLMFMKDKVVLITGNKKDFPSTVFDTVAVLNFEGEDGCVRAIGVIAFNQEKFDACQTSLKKLESV